MELQLVLLLVELCVTVSGLSADGSPGKTSPWPQKMPTKKPLVDHTWPRQPPLIQPAPAFSSAGTGHQKPVPAPPVKTIHASPHIAPSLNKEHHRHSALKPSSIAVTPSASSSGAPVRNWVHGLAPSHPLSSHKHHKSRKRFSNSAPEPSYPVHLPVYNKKGPSVSPSQYSNPSWISPGPAPLQTPGWSHVYMPILPPAISPAASSKKMATPPPSLALALPPPPPSEDCTSVTCTEPLTYTPPGLPCGCVWPIQVKLQFGVAIYTFFPLVSELAEEIAASAGLNHSQVRIMGANAASQELEKSTVLINLVPWKENFDYSTSFSIYKKFWNQKIFIKASLFGPYEVRYVRYPGLPPSPPSATSSIATVDDGPYPGHDNNGQALKPLGVNVPKKKRNGLTGSMIAVIVLSTFSFTMLCVGLIWLFLLKYGACDQEPEQVHALAFSPRKPSGTSRFVMQGSISSSASLSVSSGALTYTGTAKNFTLNDLEQATNNFDGSRIIGEGGFGIVYEGILDDGTNVAVKVLKREDQRGGREFLAEVEMLSRLHHRNLVKLIGICTEDPMRCLVYELVPNGSLESHLHGVDKDNEPLDWSARMKIALGAARGLAYLHEDSSPRVIHRDFKSSNILLEHDFTPKVSDFGLARAALDEGNKHISTHVMGTFGYLAPEYAMTGHLLVKSDVYSYGVVLLELLTGRKPVDLSQLPGQENLVAWVRPLLTSKEGLETIIDPSIKSNISFDSISKVAAIASMCVQPEVSNRPFMGEVVQALKLVCNEFDETREGELKGWTQENFTTVVDSKTDRPPEKPSEVAEVSHPIPGYNFSDSRNLGLSASCMMAIPVGLERQESGSFRRHSSSGPLQTGRRRQFLQRIRSWSRGSLSEHGCSVRLWPGSH